MFFYKKKVNEQKRTQGILGMSIYSFHWKNNKDLIFTFMHLADAFIQSDLQCNRAIHFLSVCVMFVSNILLPNTFIWIKWKLKEFQITWANILFTIEHRKQKCLNWEI